jgi:hypothetical protein
VLSPGAIIRQISFSARDIGKIKISADIEYFPYARDIAIAPFHRCAHYQALSSIIQTINFVDYYQTIYPLICRFAIVAS